MIELMKLKVQTLVFRLHLSNMIDNVYLLLKFNLKNETKCSLFEFPCILITLSVSKCVCVLQRIKLSSCA